MRNIAKILLVWTNKGHLNTKSEDRLINHNVSSPLPTKDEHVSIFSDIHV